MRMKSFEELASAWEEQKKQKAKVTHRMTIYRGTREEIERQKAADRALLFPSMWDMPGPTKEKELKRKNKTFPNKSGKNATLKFSRIWR